MEIGGNKSFWTDLLLPHRMAQFDHFAIKQKAKKRETSCLVSLFDASAIHYLFNVASQADCAARIGNAQESRVVAAMGIMAACAFNQRLVASGSANRAGAGLSAGVKLHIGLLASANTCEPCINPPYVFCIQQ